LTNTTPRFTPNFIQVTPFMIIEDLEKALLRENFYVLTQSGHVLAQSQAALLD